MQAGQHDAGRIIAKANRSQVKRDAAICDNNLSKSTPRAQQVPVKRSKKRQIRAAGMFRARKDGRSGVKTMILAGTIFRLTRLQLHNHGPEDREAARLRMYRISKPAESVGLSRAPLLYDDKLGLVQGKRQANGYRIRTDADSTAAGQTRFMGPAPGVSVLDDPVFRLACHTDLTPSPVRRALKAGRSPRFAEVHDAVSRRNDHARLSESLVAAANLRPYSNAAR